MSDWSKEATEVLIEAYKNHPNLYNTKHSKYYNRNARKESLEDIRKEVSGSLLISVQKNVKIYVIIISHLLKKLTVAMDFIPVYYSLII